MNGAAVAASLVALVAVSVTIVNYFRGVADAKVTVEITGLVAKLLAGVGLAIGAVAWAHRSGTLGAAVIVPAAIATMLAATILWLLSQRKTPVGELKVAVGDTLLPFEALRSDGQPFDSQSLAGKRVLFKFFRGGW